MRDVPSEHDSDDGDRLYKLDEFVARCDRWPLMKIMVAIVVGLIALVIGLSGADAVATGGVGPRLPILGQVYELLGEDSQRRPIAVGTRRGSFLIPNGPPTRIFGAAMLAAATTLALFVFGLSVPSTRDALSDSFVWTIGAAVALFLSSIFVSMAF